MQATHTEQQIRTASLLSRFSALAAIALLAISATGCSTTTALRYSPEAVAAYSPNPEVVAPFEALRLAKKYVADHEGTDFMVGSGVSMLPLYKDQTVVVTEKVDVASLKAGMTAVYIGDQGRPVAHVLVKRTADGWVAMGVGNAEPDETLVSKDNLMGVVVRAYQPSSSTLVALLGESAAKGRLVAALP